VAEMDVFAIGEEEKGLAIPEGNGQEVREYEVVEMGALMQMERANLDVAIATARAYPREVSRSLARAKSLACASPEIAGGMTYALKRGNKVIKGASVRLAEVMATSWGNIRYGATIIQEAEKVVVARGLAHDLETNVAASVEVRRRITHSDGRRYNDDLITVTANAACAIAMRNALFKVVPGGFVSLIQREAQKVARKESEGLEARREKALKFFESLGVKRETVFRTLGVRGVDDIDWEGIDTLLGFATSINSGEASVESIFEEGSEASQGGDTPPEGRTSLKRGSAKEQAEEATAPAQEAEEDGELL